MRATFPSRGWTRAAAVLGAVGVVAAAAVSVVGIPNDPAAVIWFTPFVGAYVGGLLAFRLQPSQVAARRLLVFGSLATIFIGSTVAVVLAYEAHGNQWWLGPANVGVQFVGLAMEAAMIALLAVYPDGRYHRAYESRTVRIAAMVAW